MLTREECLKALEDIAFVDGFMNLDHMLNYDGAIALKYKVIHELIEEHFERIDVTKQLNDELFEYIEENNRLRQSLDALRENEPLKFEEIKKGDWVWDEKEKWWRNIVIVFEPCKEYPMGSFKAWNDSGETNLDFIRFEENRYYRKVVE